MRDLWREMPDPMMGCLLKMLLSMVLLIIGLLFMLLVLFTNLGDILL